MIELLVFAGGFLAAFIGSMSGGGAGFVAFAALLYAGLPVKAAVATNIFGDFGFFPMAVRNFSKAGQVKRKALPAILIISVLGALIGSLLIIYIDEAIFNRLLGLIMIFVIVVILKNHKLPVKPRKPSQSWMPVYFSAKVVSGISSVGTGILGSLTLLHLRGFTPMQALANSFVGNTAASIAQLSLLILATNFIDYRLGAFCFVGNMAGAYFGSKIAIKRGNKFINYAIVTMAVVAVVQLALL